MAGLVCSICLDVEPPEGEETDTLTVINGQMVCVFHAVYAQGEPHSAMISAAEQARSPEGGEPG